MKRFVNAIGILIIMSIKTYSITAAPDIFKRKLDNGLTVIAVKTDSLQDASIQLWYNVGSKHEASSEKGLAHLIEHMIFKGTEKLSEPDINIISHMLSAYANATTSYDWTNYLFDVPLHNWKLVLPIMADCMKNCTFKEDILNAELKVVIQELKMNRDNYGRTIALQALTSAFPDHPYHYPVIGFKQDLWNLKQENLYHFYQVHYNPSNATLVVVGNINPEEVYQEAKKCFGHIPAGKKEKDREFYFNRDISAQKSDIYRDIQNTQVVCAFVIPGLKDSRNYLVGLISALLTDGKDTRLHKRLVDTDKLVRYVASQSFGLFDHDLFMIFYQPYNPEDIDTINGIIIEEINKLAANIEQKELERASRIYLSSSYDFFQSNHSQASAIGKNYLATGNEYAAYEKLEKLQNSAVLKEEISNFMKTFFRKSIMHQALAHPLPADELAHWQELQALSIEEDNKILQGRVRTSEVEAPREALLIKPNKPGDYKVAIPEIDKLANDLKVISHYTNSIPKISIILNLKADSDYEPSNLPGLYRVMQKTMLEGTKNYPGELFVKELEDRAIDLEVQGNVISMSLLEGDLEKALELLQELVTQCEFKQDMIDKVKKFAHIDIDNFWDSPDKIAFKLVSDYIYKGHPYSSDHLGTHESIDAITRDDIQKLYRTVHTPNEATITVVGKFDKKNLMELLERYIGTLQKKTLKPIVYPDLSTPAPTTISYQMNRDQIVVLFMGLSVKRRHPDYQKLLLFNEIFGKGMDSKLFELRERSGAFYAISGSLTSYASHEPGMCVIKTIVSPERESEAIAMIRDCVATTIDTVTQEELDKAKNSLLCSPANLYAKNGTIASVLSDLDEYGYPFDYFIQRKDILEKITLDEVKEAARKILRNDQLSVIRVGPVNG